jgi:hypothetical protein
MDPNAPRTGPLGQPETLTVDPEHLKRLAGGRTFADTGESSFAALGPQTIDPNGYSTRMKAAPLTAVSLAERAKLLAAGEQGIQDATQSLVEESPTESFGMLLTVVNYMCITSFIEPKVVATLAEEDTVPGSIHYSRIPQEARMRFWALMQQEAEEMAAAAQPFPVQTGESGDPGAVVRPDELPSE